MVKFLKSLFAKQTLSEPAGSIEIPADIVEFREFVLKRTKHLDFISSAKPVNDSEQHINVVYLQYANLDDENSNKVEVNLANLFRYIQTIAGDGIEGVNAEIDRNLKALVPVSTKDRMDILVPVVRNLSYVEPELYAANIKNPTEFVFPFCGDICTILMCNFPETLTTISSGDMKLDENELYTIALANLDRQIGNLYESQIGEFTKYSCDDSALGASIILMGQFATRISEVFPQGIIAIIPDRTAIYGIGLDIENAEEKARIAIHDFLDPEEGLLSSCLYKIENGEISEM